ncbi:MAG TPA: hemerythrin domain-containing protein [Micromonosporaceae bacterium]
MSGNSADQRAALAMVGHHAELAEALTRQVGQVLNLVERAELPAADRARLDLVAWLRRELVPHAMAEESALYPAAADDPRGRLLIEGMLAEHRAITELVEEIDAWRSPVRGAAAAATLAGMFASHLAKENDLILPLLVSSDQVSLADLLAGMHELLGDQGEAARQASGHQHVAG